MARRACVVPLWRSTLSCILVTTYSSHCLSVCARCKVLKSFHSTPPLHQHINTSQSIMSGKKVTPHQMRKNLAYVQEGKPDFMRMLTGQSEEAANKDPRNPYRKPIGIEAKFQHEEQDNDDETAHDILNEREEERPTVVVLKDGKHLDERQVKNILKNLPAGLSDVEIQKRLAEGKESSSGDEKSQSEEEEEEDADPVDANGKILFRRPKSSKKSSKDSKGTTGLSSSKNKKSFEEIMLAEAEAKVSQLKRKSGAVAVGGSATTELGSKKPTASKKTESSGTKKKQKTSKATTSMLSFGDEEE